MFKFRMVGLAIRNAGLGYATALFVIAFACATLAVFALDPGVDNLGDAAWFCFQAVTTIGFGDIVVTSVAARIVTVVLSIMSVIYLAVLTGAVVSFCSENMKQRRDESVAHFLDQLNHLDEMTPEELHAFSDKVRAFDRRR